VTDDFVIELLASHHHRSAFSCGVVALDRYLREQAGQDARRLMAKCFVATPDRAIVAAFYTFAATSIPADDLGEEERRRLPRYSIFPAVLIGRLAVDQRFRDRGLGAALIFDAAERATRSDAAIFALVVDAKDESAAEFYRHIGFRAFKSKPRSLFLPIAGIGKMP
jgi:GNAT superfamily N-acetyltransferase